MLGEMLLATTVVGGLIVSESPTPQAIEDYQAWNANTVVLWEADDAASWGRMPAVVWLDEAHQAVSVNPDGSRLASEASLAGNVVAVQAGDEPGSIEALASTDGLPVSAHTNFSYWAPGDEAMLAKLLAAYDGDRVSVSEYNLDKYRPYVLSLFREAALAKGVPYWQYMNAYSGYETGFKKSQTFADYAWQGFSGLAMGYTGHVWFAYQLSDVGHPEAIQGGGSTITAEPGSWNLNPDHYRWTGTVNKMLLRFGAVTERLTSTDVCFPRLADWMPDTSCGDGTIVGTFNDGTKVTVNDSRTESVEFETEQRYVYLPNGVAFEGSGVIEVGPGMAALTSDERHDGFMWMS